MACHNALFAGEKSSHFYFGNFYPFSDGILATLLMAEIISKNNKLSMMVDKIESYPTLNMYIDCKTHSKKKVVMKKLEKKFFEEYENIDTLDGLKIWLNEIEWVIIRSSNTMPSINLSIEAKNKDRLLKLKKYFSKIIEEQISINY